MYSKTNYIATIFVDLANFVLQMQACGTTIDCAGLCGGSSAEDDCGVCDDNGANDCTVQTCDEIGYDPECNTCTENDPTQGVRAVTAANLNVECGSAGNICSAAGVCDGSK